MKKILYLFLAMRFVCPAANEEVISSFQSGTSSSNIPLVIGNQLVVEDNWNLYMTLNNPGYTSLFSIRDNKVIVRLRYDDALKFDPGFAWTLTVSYHTEFTDLLGNITTTPPGAYNLTINYLDHSSPTNYTDIAINTHTNPNSFKVKVVIDNIAFTPASSSTQNTIPSTFLDIYLDVIESTERYYILTNTAPVVNVPTSFNINNMQGDNSVRLPLAWTYVSGAESYDLDWLFIDVGNNHYFPSTGYDFDFKNATRINISENHYEIPLAYSAGIILFRVRPVGYDLVSGDLIRREGVWSALGFNHGNTTNDAPFASQNFRYDFAGLNPDKNWLYKSSFSEEGKRKEMILFSDDGLKDRQLTTYSNTENNVIISESVYDHEGRLALDVIPTPAPSAGMQYYAFNPNYDPANFDTDLTITAPDPYPIAGAGYYYDISNTLPGGLYKEYVPDAEHFPFIRTRFTTDGTSRVRAQAALGVSHNPGSGHEVNFIYAKPDQEEIDRLFGNEVGYSNNYSKTGKIDENGRPEITYYDNHQRIIAKCLAGDAPANLLDIDNKPPGTTMVIDLLAAHNETTSAGQLISSHQMAVMAATTYHFDYDLLQSQFCKNCPNFTLCEDCKYDLTILITDENGLPVSGSNIIILNANPAPDSSPNPLFWSNITQADVSFDVTLQPGTYSIDKILQVNQANATTIAGQFINGQILNPTCISYPLIEPLPCDVSCRTACEERYTRFDFSTNEYYYVDDVEAPISASQATVLIQNCEQICESPQLPEEAGYCALKLIALKKDMSPGGQYFSNTMQQFTLDLVEGVITNTAYPSLEFNWLNTNLSSQSSSIFNSLSTIAGMPISSWAEVKANFQEAFLDVLVKYHPEFCAYNYFCNGAIICGVKGSQSPPDTIKIPESNSFDYNLSLTTQANASAHGYFNTLPMPVNSTHSTADFLTGNSSYCTYTNSLNSADADPFVRIACSVNLGNCSTSPSNYLKEQLGKYLHVGNGNYFSIWYVLDDPDNIHLIPTANAFTPPQQIIDIFKQLHGDGTTANPGLFASSSKWEFYRSAYLFYKQLFIHRYYTQYACPAPSVKNPLAAPPMSVAITHSLPTIHFPNNPIFGQIINNSPTGICTSVNGSQTIVTAFSSLANNGVANTCSTNCTQAANDWMQQLSGCNLTPTQTNNIKFYLIEVCKKECNSSNITGSSGCDINIDPNCQAVTGPNSTLFYNFTDVINYFTSSTCQVNIVYPPNTSDAGCACANLVAFASANNISVNNPAQMAASLNSAFGSTYTPTDVSNWQAACNQSHSTLADPSFTNYPNVLRCVVSTTSYDDSECSCNKIRAFINQIGYDPDNSLHYPNIVTAINNYFALPPGQQINLTQLTTVLSDCISTQSAQFALNNIPPVLLCPVPTGATSEEIAAAEELAACQLQNLLGATSNAVQIFNANLQIQENDFKNQYIAHCLSNAKVGSESFTKTYILNEYLYTLYYYDQAGNLVKTVPPEGFEELPANLYQAVKDYRDGVTGATPHYPSHRMISRYRYDSQENKLDYESPDQELITYWYDSQGRIVLSQTGKQRATTPVPAYSYSQYDLLSRIIRTEQIYNPAASLTYDEATAPITLSTWLGAITDNDQVTSTYYDAVFFNLIPTPFSLIGQTNLRHRVSHVVFEEDDDGNPQTYDYGTHYSYNIHGIPTVVSQENNYRDGSMSTAIFPAVSRFQTSEYEYDLISCNVTRVIYQRGKTEASWHSFAYDANNRLKAVSSSIDGMIWDTDAKYFYYDHGPLARKELGDKHIQGCDYAYTIRNWVKAMNSSVLSPQYDIGKDGLGVALNINSHFATDAFGYANGYFRNDYKSIDPNLMISANNFEANVFLSANSFGDYLYNNTSSPHDYGLYNGNISYCAQHSQINTGGTMNLYGRAYRYDMLYRFKDHKTFSDPQVATLNTWNNTTVDNNTGENFSYDYNGNIAGVTRTVSGVTMDALTYEYLLISGYKANNKLLSIHDLPSLSSNFTEDLDDQISIPSNYAYNENGDLYQDNSTGIKNVVYNAYGKIKKIERDPFFISGPTYPSDLEFFYDGFGRRVVKVEKPRILVGSQTQIAPIIDWKYTIYAYDGKDDLSAIYTMQGNNSNLKISERYITGNGRVAQINKETLIGQIPSPDHFERELGLKTFELSQVTDNVNTTVLDYKVSGNTTGLTVNFYKPVVLSAIDYLAYGTHIPGRKYVTESFRYGVNAGSEKDEEVMNLDNIYTTYYRELDTRTGKWWSIDPAASANESPYAVNNNNPINVVDPMGDKGNPLYDNKTSGEDGFTQKFEFRRDNYGWIASYGAKYKFKFLTPSVNVSLRKYSGGLGAPDGSTRLDLVASPAVTFGRGKGPASELNLFNGYSLSSVDDEYANSLTIGANLIYNRNRVQYENSAIIRIRQFNMAIYNDLRFIFSEKSNDRWWTGGGRIGWNTAGGKYSHLNLGTISVGTDVFTGERIIRDPNATSPADKYQTYTRGGNQYYTQADPTLVNGVTYLSISGKKKKYSIYGGSGHWNPLWSQNFIHSLYKDLPYFDSRSPFKFVKTTYK